MRKLSLLSVIALVLTLSAVTLNPPPPVEASPADEYAAAAPYFGEDNLPPGCEGDVRVSDLTLEPFPSTYQDPDSFGNVCHHMRTDMNGLDSPQVDVVVMVPASPTAERDMRIMRQSVEMWEGGIDYLAEEMGLGWLAEGMDFHITVDSFDPTGESGGEFTTYPIVDPEIVVVAASPAVVGYAGIGIDPVDSIFVNEDFVPCHAVANPFDIEQWENLPGFNSHHETRSGTYVEDCGGGGGGNICFAVNAGNDPAVLDISSLFDLVSHEFGHCLTIGHVGDGAEGKWGANPTNDIMAYHSDPPGLTKCVSTLNVEGIALRMSKYLDTNGDGAVDEADLLQANDQIGEGQNDFQIQHPDDHLYASGTGSPLDCPQPDTGVLPGPRTDWTPTPVRTSEPTLTITSPDDGAVNDSGIFNVTGTVERVSLNQEVDPGTPSASFDDADDDATSALTEILDVNVDVTATHVNATMRLSELTPPTDGASATNYTLAIDGKEFHSFVYGIGFVQPRTFEGGAEMAEGTSTWDTAAKTVTFNIPRDYLTAAGVASPYFATTSASFGNALIGLVVDDRAPEGTSTLGVSHASSSLGLPEVRAGLQAETVTFQHPGPFGNTFFTEDTSFGVDRGTRHEFALDVPQTSDVEFNLAWTAAVPGTDLDLYVTGAGVDSGSLGASANTGVDAAESFILEDVKGLLNLSLDPYFVTDPLSGAKYTLAATIVPVEVTVVDTDLDGILDDADACPNEPGVAPTGCPDSDGDGVIDSADVCPAEPGSGADGCPIRATEQVLLYVGGTLAGSQDVDTANGPDGFALSVGLAEGTHDVRVDWVDSGKVLASRSLSLTHNTDDDGDGVVNDADACPGFDDFDDLDQDGVADGCDTDSDADGAADHRDNCRDVPNPDQADLDRDGRGDACDTDKDGDGHSNDKELAHSTDPSDPGSYPGKAKTGSLKL